MLQTIGENIRQIRKARRMSCKQLADDMSILIGEDISESLVSAWQRGDRRISADNLLVVADILECSVVQLCGRRQSLDLSHHLSEHERQIVRYAFDEWKGDVHPLIELMGLYMAFPYEVRAQVACSALHVYKESIKNGIKPNAPYEVRYEYIRSKYMDLLNKEGIS